MTALACPTPRELAAYDQGHLSPEQIDELSRHLEHCSPCLALLEGLSPLEDPLLELLSRNDLLPSPQPRELAALLQRAADIPRSTLPFTLTHWQTRSLPVSELPADVLPRELGQYRLQSVLGRGGMGTVYKALHMRLEKIVALKVLSPERLQDPHALIRFEREMKAIGRLRHPRIVAAHDAGEALGAHFLVMELIDGVDLATLVRKRGPLAIADACELARQTAEGLQAIDEHRLVHRDIKPSNLMLTHDGQLKILDLGLALLQSPDSIPPGPLDGDSDDPSKPIHILGTVDFLAPEQARDSRSVDIRADLYSLGATLVKLLTGQPPYPAPHWPTIERKLAAHGEAPPPDLLQLRPDAPPELARVVHRLLAKRPGDRFQTPAECAAALERFAGGACLANVVDSFRESTAPPIAHTSARPSRAMFTQIPHRHLAERVDRKRRYKQAGLAALLVSLFALATYLLTGEGQLTLRLPDPGHRIEIDGRPAASDLAFLPDRTEQHFRLPSGQHSVRVSKLGHQPLFRQFWLVRNRHVEFDVLLPPDPQASVPPPLPSERPNMGPPVATDNPAHAWELSIRSMADRHNDVLYRPLKADWAGAERIGLIEDAIFFGPFGAEQPDSIWIFRTHVQAKAATTVQVFFGHDDGGVIYLNGELVNSAPTTAGRSGHLAFVGPLRFRPGLNTVEMAVYVAQGASSINLGAIAPQYKHAVSQVPGLTMRAPP